MAPHTDGLKEARVTVGQLMPTDAARFVALAAASRELHHPWTSAPDTPEAFQFVLERQSPTFQTRVVRTRDTGELVGVFNLSQIVLGAFCSAYLGYYAFAPTAGRGLMGEGLDLLLQEAFHRLGLHRVEANIQPGNTRSMALVRRAGFVREGFSPGYLRILGEWRDHERWALRQEVWHPRILAVP